MPQKSLEQIGTTLFAFGVLVIIGSIVAFVIGPETMTYLYERIKPIFPFFMIGVGLIVLGIFLAPQLFSVKAISEAKTVPGLASEGKPCCGNCKAINDEGAKFCNQCGKAF